MMQYIIWGAGHRGKILYELLGKEKVIAYIDSNPEKIGKTYMGCPVIAYQEYKEKYRSFVVIVSMVFNGGVAALLDKDDVFYFGVEKCPPEFMGYGLNTAKDAWQKINLKIPDHVVLYGCTLYTMMVYEYLKQKGYFDLAIMLPDAMEEKKRKMFSTIFPDARIITEDDLGSACILLTEKTDHLDHLKINRNFIDLVDWTQFVSGYHNKKIEMIKNQYKDQRCFIVATGPSLTYDDLETLDHNCEFCFSLNSIFECFTETKWRPDCYAIVDADGIMMWKDQFYKLDEIPYKFIADCQPYFDYSKLDDNWYIYHSILDDYSIRNMLFSDDFSRRAYNGSTIVYVCIQLAIYMGFKEIYLLGVDYSYKMNEKNHFTKQLESWQAYDGVNLQNKIQDVSYAAFQKAKVYASEHGINIFNATRKSCLDVFETVDFDELF